MSTLEPLPEETELEKTIDKLFADLENYESHSDEYSAIVDQIAKLYKLKEIENPKKVSPDTLVLVAGNIIGIVLILGFERAHVVTSKAINFVMKLR